MSYEAALNKAWENAAKFNTGKVLSVKFLADEYTINFATKTVYSLSCNIPAKEFVAILILHYFIKSSSGLPMISGEWKSFKELSGVEGYADAFRKRCIEPIIRKYGRNPKGILLSVDRLKAVQAAQADAAVIVQAFEGVPVLIEVWAGDDEFGPEANMLFDKSIGAIFCTEDIVVLAGFVAAAL